jgi:hypothetical protein
MLLVIAKTCKHACEWVNKMVVPVEYYPVLKRNGIPSHEKTWRKLRCLLLSERSESEKAMYHLIPTK